MHPRWRLIEPALAGALILWALTSSQAQPAGGSSAPRTDLDVLMEQVLANRDETWTHLRDYVLDERERFALVGPDGARLFGQDREYTWYARDGIGVRSPTKANGVVVSEAERQRYEVEWLRDEHARETRQRERDGRRAVGQHTGQRITPPSALVPEAAQPTLANPLEPRFVSEAFFLKFRFEPGNYFFAGREMLDGREVLKVEYLPTRLYDDEVGSVRDPNPDPVEADIERKMNKVALVTLWIDQAAKQIVRYTFDNVEFGFLPSRTLARLDAVRASMTMATVLDGVWLPQRVTMDGAVTLATGTYRLDYSREFSGYRRGETSVTIRVREER